MAEPKATPRIEVVTTNESELSRAAVIATTLQIPLAGVYTGPTDSTDFFFVVAPHYLGLQVANEKMQRPFFIDFTHGTQFYRREHATLKSEMIARSLGVKPNDNALIVDATAGLGKDGFILAALGFRTILLERSPILYLLLKDAIERANLHTLTQPATQRLQLFHTDSVQWLNAYPTSSAEPISVVYLDPMFPPRQKSAAVKKDLSLLQRLLPEAFDQEQLLSAALACATKRVVVKRPRLAAPLADLKPHHSLVGNSSRFDVYLTPR